MSAQDDELVRRYREASALEDARPGAQVREAVRAHARTLAAATVAPPPAAAQAVAAAANQPRWKIRALAAVAVVGLTGLLMLQLERGAPEEKDIAFGQRRTESPAPATVPAPAPVAETSPAADAAAQKPPAAPAPVQAKKSARAAPAAEAESRPDSSSARATAGFPAPPPPAANRSLAQPSAEMSKRSAVAGNGPLPQGLQEAARAGRTPEVESLIRQGAPIDARDGAGRTALMLAAMNGHTATVQKLLTLGANPALVDREGLNAARHARQRGHAHIADLIGTF